MILSANCHHYLPDMLVALEIAMRFDNVFKGKCLVDYGFQRTVGETLQHKICHFGAFFRNQYRFENANEFKVANFARPLIGSIMAGDMSSAP